MKQLIGSSASKAHLALGLAGALLVTACGGGGGGDAGPTPVVLPGFLSGIPASATASSAGALAFVVEVVNSSSESTEPLVAGDEVLGSSDAVDADSSV